MLSPLLANIALSALDDHFDRQWQQEMGTSDQRQESRKRGLGNWRIIRYADDFVLMVHGERRHAEALREEVAAVLAPLGLRLAPEKTRVVHIDEGFDFLGFTIRRMRKRGTQKYYVYTKPSKKAIQAIKDKVKAKTYRSTRNMDLDELIASLNRSLAGWANYFRHGVSKAVFSTVDNHAWNRLMRWIRPSTTEAPARDAGTPPPFLRPGMEVRLQRGRVHRRGQRAGDPLPLPRNTIPTPWTPGTSPSADPAGKTRGAPGAVRPARRVRRGAGETHRERSRQGAPIRPDPDWPYCEALARLAGLLADVPFALEWHVPTGKVVTDGGCRCRRTRWRTCSGRRPGC